MQSARQAAVTGALIRLTLGILLPGKAHWSGVVIGLVLGNWPLAAVASLLPSLGGVLGVWIYRRWLDPRNLRK
jgi:hypothetical protein